MPPKKSATKDAATTDAPKPKPKGKAAKRAREEDDATTPTVDGAAATTAATATATTGTENLPLLKAFEDLMFYEFTFADKFAALSHLYLTTLLRTKFSSTPITASKDIPYNSGEVGGGRQWGDFVGRGQRQMIDEFFKDDKHTLDRLEELKSEHGGSGVVVVVDDALRDAIKATEVVGKPIDDATKAKIAAEVPKYQSMTVDTLKALLRSNRQPVTGAKAELIKRISEGVVLGALPACPHCYGGKLKYDVESATYHCHGFMDDDTYRFCYYRAADAERAPWV